MAARKKNTSKQVGRQAVRLQTVLGHVVAARRRELNLSQGELAQKLRVSPGTASKIEAGQVVSLDQLWLLAVALDMPASELMVRVEKAVEALRGSGVAVALRRAAEQPSADTEMLKTAALTGILGFLLARK